MRLHFQLCDKWCHLLKREFAERRHQEVMLFNCDFMIDDLLHFFTMGGLG